MNKIDEEYAFNNYYKTYQYDGLNAIDIVELLQMNGVVIDNIEVSEGVERDMQTISGARFTADSFKQNYGSILVNGSELVYHIKAQYNSVDIIMTVNEESKKIVFETPEESIELTDIIKKNESDKGLTM